MHFKHINRLTIRKAPQATGHFWFADEEDDENNMKLEDVIPADCRCPNIKQLILEIPEILKGEIEGACMICNEVEWLMLSGENCLETQIDLTSLPNIKRLEM